MSPIETDVTVIVPAYNEVRRIAATIEEIRTYFRSAGLTCQIIVSADGDDGTRETAAAESRPDDPIIVIGSAARGGKGRGIRGAVPLATGRIIGFVDADQKTPVSEFDKVRPAFEDGADVVIGSRGLRGSQIENPQPWYRQAGSRGFAVFMHTVVGLGSIPDTQCGFKFFRADVARTLFARQRIDGYMFDVEILYLAERLRLPHRAGPGAVARRRRLAAQSDGGQSEERAGHLPDPLRARRRSDAQRRTGAFRSHRVLTMASHLPPTQASAAPARSVAEAEQLELGQLVARCRHSRVGLRLRHRRRRVLLPRSRAGPRRRLVERVHARHVVAG